MISVGAALEQLFELVTPLDTETVPLVEASGRVMAQDAIAERDQPPFSASAMDGYAVRSADISEATAFKVIGESAAGHAFDTEIGPNQCARIFTGAPLPAGADRVIIQEDVTRDGDTIKFTGDIGTSTHIRAQASDFAIGDALTAPRRLRPSDIALLAAMNVDKVTVYRKPDIALISTGDELVMPGETPGPDQIIASNTFGLKAMLDELGANARILPIARDNRPALELCFDLAKDADLIVTIGGASVGDHDLVGKVAADLGLDQKFYKIAMRPGKPLMAGKLQNAAFVGLPGNPVSAMVCGHVFLKPMVLAMLGFPAQAAPRLEAPITADIPANGPREHYMRAHLKDSQITAESRQDSALLSVFADANALLVRPPHDGPRKAGEIMDYLPI
ncbi:Molybdopterin molybdenumtransferase [Roseovarius albus]|uniref:Molybdopterin molybdenumtransferase n=1 Tax=Roseovarius albus TaxID=1247867 RepID=A0A1X6Z136_9RHOB|nr:gephyrin-like molybdotransferase Glp [Roseovarius albus]SLN37742.1 Molybdopterin molybdenumtransferase [Roseovarius albus]